MWPKGFEERLGQIGNLDTGRMKASMQQPRVRAACIAHCKVSDTKAEEMMQGKTKVPWEEAFLLDDSFWGNEIMHRIGAYYVQEPSAMLPVAALEWDPSWKVLDLCAAPGGKTHQLACRIKNGMVYANEIVPNRARTLLSNMERTGAGRIVVLNEEPWRLQEHFRGYFDAVLVDAPCSGEGMFRRDPQAVQDWSEEHSDACAIRQRKILGSADAMLKEGGFLVYATCTFSLQENEQVVEPFMKAFGYVPVKPLSAAKENTLRGITEMTRDAGRYVPYLGMGEGQFFMVMQKTRSAQEPQRITQAGERPDRKLQQMLRRLLEDCGLQLQGEFRLLKDTVIWIPDASVLLPEGLRYLRCGTAVATLKKDRLEPHHHFFSAFGPTFANRICLNGSSPEASAYLRGEELGADMLNDGYAAVMIDGISAGGVRVRKGRAKNLYPKGLRG